MPTSSRIVIPSVAEGSRFLRALCLVGMTVFLLTACGLKGPLKRPVSDTEPQQKEEPKGW